MADEQGIASCHVLNNMRHRRTTFFLFLFLFLKKNKRERERESLDQSDCSESRVPRGNSRESRKMPCARTKAEAREIEVAVQVQRPQRQGFFTRKNSPLPPPPPPDNPADLKLGTDHRGSR